jgi:hypothetical protein
MHEGKEPHKVGREMERGTTYAAARTLAASLTRFASAAFAISTRTHASNGLQWLILMIKIRDEINQDVSLARI